MSLSSVHPDLHPRLKEVMRVASMSFLARRGLNGEAAAPLAAWEGLRNTYLAHVEEAFIQMVKHALETSQTPALVVARRTSLPMALVVTSRERPALELPSELTANPPTKELQLLSGTFFSRKCRPAARILQEGLGERASFKLVVDVRGSSSFGSSSYSPLQVKVDLSDIVTSATGPAVKKLQKWAERFVEDATKDLVRKTREDVLARRQRQWHAALSAEVARSDKPFPSFTVRPYEIRVELELRNSLSLTLVDSQWENPEAEAPVVLAHLRTCCEAFAAFNTALKNNPNFATSLQSRF